MISFFLYMGINLGNILGKTYYILGDEKVNNFEDYCSYINYMTGNNIPNNMGIGNNYNGISNNSNYVSMPLEAGYANLSNRNNLGYQSVDNGIFANTFMMPNENNELLSPKEGLKMGNLFKNQYNGYKNYKPSELAPKTEREKLLYEIMGYSFAMNDLDLYLNCFPSNSAYINLYNEYKVKNDKLVSEYEKKYGPLTLNSNELGTNKWLWNDSP